MAPPAVTDLTKREREVWSLVAAHLTNKEIADRLFLSVRTVESHVSSLIQKLDVADRRALARYPGLAPVGGRWTGSRWPAPASSFIGRTAECTALREAIAAHRMVTITGPGGVGKTRLALHVVEPLAAMRRDGGCFVDLVHVSDPAMVLGAIASAAGVVAPVGGSLADALSTVLAGSDAVILLDNCEHLIDAVRDAVARLIRSCSSLAIVATSRLPLRAPFEWVFPVPGLSLAERDGDAARLFEERAQSAGVTVPLDAHQVAALCASLGGMALAIELAAARCPALGLDGLIAGLDQRLRLLTLADGGDRRHGSLREAIAWSYRLLPAPDRDLLATVSVFAAWFDVSATLAVLEAGTRRFDAADSLARLADHSLVLVEPGQPTRYRLLETIRQFGAEQLNALGRSEKVHERHRRWCGVALAQLAQQPRDEAWCERLDDLAADARAAVMNADSTRSVPAAQQAARLAEQLAGQVLLRGRPQEAQSGYEQAAALDVDPVQRARLLRLAAGAAACSLVGNDTLRLLREAADQALASGEPCAAAVDLAARVMFVRWAPGILASPPERGADEVWLAEAESLAGDAAAPRAVIAVAAALGLPDDDARVDALIEQGITLARQAQMPLIESVALDRLCASHLARAELLRSIEKTALREDLLIRQGLDASTAYHFNDYLLMASELCLAAGQLESAAAYADRLAALDCYRDYPHPALARRIKVDAMAGDFQAVVERGEQFLAAWQRAGRPVSGTLGVTAYAVAMVHGMRGDEARRRQWIELTKTLTSHAVPLNTCAWAQAMDALLALDRGQPEMAFARLSSDVDDRSVWSSSVLRMWRPWYAALWAESAALVGHSSAAGRLERAAAATRENEVAATIVRRAADLLAGRPSSLREHSNIFLRLGCDYQRRRTEALAHGGSSPGASSSAD
ncbi:LuxR C-terminal-related transcriptional regulator [Piscinibacter sp. XHJ-5]|uniref:ATP-binding protein n=1 Tax=Piscinibacter sp. XHJ-5 TaxID=3037797 RepID=UPI0024535BDE|nr:LuxR C-terminal-related transcriptional regulator [Piscinibacter sp. XHJ-5]